MVAHGIRASRAGPPKPKEILPLSCGEVALLRGELNHAEEGHGDIVLVALVKLRQANSSSDAKAHVEWNAWCVGELRVVMET